MKELLNLSMTKAKELMLKGEFTSTELTEAHLRCIEDKNPELNTFITVTADLALKQASLADENLRNKNAGLIEGLVIGVKDLFCTKGIRTTAASHILENFVPHYESTVTTLLRQQGGVTVGKTNMDEFAMGSANITSYYGSVKNPWKRAGDDRPLVPGGSSGGSAAAVAAKMCMGALGSDTGGSVRQPAAFCGIVGVKPTYGRCSRYGMVAFASSLDQAGVFTRSIEDSALLLESICGHDQKDATSSEQKIPNWLGTLKSGVKGLKIGIPKEYMIEGMNQEIIEVWEQGKSWLKEAGAEIIEVSLPHTKYALPVYYIIAPSEASSNLARYDGVRYGLRVPSENGSINDMISATRAVGFGNEVKRRIMIGTYLLSSNHYDAHYLQAQKIRRLIYNDFQEAFNQVDAMLTPTVPSTAFRIGEKVNDPVTMYLNDVLTVTVNLAGLPGISVPAGLGSDGLPLGLQLISKAYDEETIFKAAYVIERAAGFKGL